MADPELIGGAQQLNRDVERSERETRSWEWFRPAVTDVGRVARSTVILLTYFGCETLLSLAARWPLNPEHESAVDNILGGFDIAAAIGVVAALSIHVLAFLWHYLRSEFLTVGSRNEHLGTDN
jgi:hypothetical protein